MLQVGAGGVVTLPDMLDRLAGSQEEYVLRMLEYEKARAGLGAARRVLQVTYADVC